ncbi:MAG: NTP transferase domain-containing protein [Natronomonas sp.]
MDCLVLCGGRGTRLNAGEKPLVSIEGQAMIDRVLTALESADRIETVYAVTSPHAPRTRDRLDGRVPIVEGSGDGYVTDLTDALADDRIEQPVVTVVSDLPLLTESAVDRTLEAYGEEDDGDGGSLTVCVPTAVKRALGVSADSSREHDGRKLSPVGLNVVGDGPEAIHVSHDARLAVNVNRPDDLTVAEVLAGGS